MCVKSEIYKILIRKRLSLTFSILVEAAIERNSHNN